MNEMYVLSNNQNIFTTIKSKIKKEISLKNLRKTYISWVNFEMGIDTPYVSSHSTNGVLEKFYLDPKILTAIETASLKVRVFGNKVN